MPSPFPGRPSLFFDVSSNFLADQRCQKYPKVTSNISRCLKAMCSHIMSYMIGRLSKLSMEMWDCLKLVVIFSLLKQDEQLAQHWLKVMCLAIQGHTVFELKADLAATVRNAVIFRKAYVASNTCHSNKIFQHWSNKKHLHQSSHLSSTRGLWPVSAMSFIKYLTELSSQFKHPGGMRNSSVV